MIKPITPEAALSMKKEYIPSFVIEAVNELLAKRFSGNNIVIIKQNEVIERAEQIGQDDRTLPAWAKRQTFFDEHWLDFEPIYREAGWKVTFDKPAFDENYEANWKFERNLEREAEQQLGRRW